MNGKFYTAILLTCGISACSGTAVLPPIQCPVRPELQAISPELQQQTPPEVLVIAAQNQIRLKQHILLLETYCTE